MASAFSLVDYARIQFKGRAAEMHQLARERACWLCPFASQLSMTSEHYMMRYDESVAHWSGNVNSSFVNGLVLIDRLKWLVLQMDAKNNN